MNAERLIEWYERVADAPDAIDRLREFVVDLAVRGKLVEQNTSDSQSTELISLIGDATTGSALPSSWVQATVGDLVTFNYGKGLKKADRLESGSVPVFGSNGIVGYTESAITDKSALIIGRKGSAGALNLVEGPSWTTDVAYYVEPPEYFDLRYLFITLSALKLATLGKGVKPGLSRSDAYGLKLSVPPLAEQHRIVAKVGELMALCDRLEAAQSQAADLRSKLLDAVLANTID